MEARNARSNSPAGGGGVRHSPGREAAVIQESFIRRVRFVEWKSALVLGELEKLNATLAEAEKEWGR